MSAYCASKSGLNALFDSLAVEMRVHGIKVTTVCPGWIRTPMTKQIESKLPHLLELDDAVRRILDAVRRERRFVAFPWPLAIFVRLLRWLPPAFSDRLITRRAPAIRIASKPTPETARD